MTPCHKPSTTLNLTWFTVHDTCNGFLKGIGAAEVLSMLFEAPNCQFINQIYIKYSKFDDI